MSEICIDSYIDIYFGFLSHCVICNLHKHLMTVLVRKFVVLFQNLKIL